MKNTPRDIFLHLLAIIALYVSAGSFIALIFQYINILHPDPLAIGGADGMYYSAYLQSAYSTIRWSLSTLIFVFPTYVLTSWYLNKTYKQSPEHKNLWIRKWLVYFTLFVAAIVIIGDLVTLVYNLLGGEFTTRFLLKITTILFVGGGVFYYYFWDLRRSKIE